MLGTVHLSTFVMSGILLNIYPGPDTLYIISRSLSQGKGAGIVSALGIGTGALIHTLLAGIGLSSLLSASPMAFYGVKLLGAVYLIYLGIRIILAKAGADKTGSYLENQTRLQIYKQGLLTNLFNPKVALFFLSFLPQFVDPVDNYGPLSFLFLGLIILTTGTLWCLFVAVFSASVSETIRKHQKVHAVFEKLTGIIFLGLGLNIIRP